MRIALLLVVLLLAACSPVCVKPLLSNGKDCCLDQNDDAVCDKDEPDPLPVEILNATNSTVSNPEPVANPAFDDAVTVNASPVVDGSVLSITEQYAQMFNAKANNSWWVWSEDPYYGRTWMWGHYDLIKLTSPQHLFWVDNVSMTLNTSLAEIDADQEMLAKDVHERRKNYADYAWWNLTSGTLGACYVYFNGAAGTYYVKTNCMEDNSTKPDGSPTGKQIIWENLTFVSTPMTPLAWLGRFDGKTPLKIQYNRTYLDEDWNSQYLVDYLFFDNGNGTVTKLFIHQGYKVPVRVEFLKDNKVIWYQRYRAFSVNDMNLHSYDRTFAEEI